jgi:cyclopropane-fatty-acyl-phospholipid synthase
VLDIGCGWGGLALYLAELCGARVTGITLSQRQLALARGRAAEKGLADKVEFRLQDYRDVPEKFDRIVSVGMFEHVGVGFYDAFFGKCSSLLDEHGIMLLHSIGRSEGPNVTNPWIAKYIFPGGYIPALSEVLPAVERAGLLVTDVEILRLHYAETLEAWRERFLAHREEVERLYDARFTRMWEFYLAAAETAFREQAMMVFQLQLTKRQDVVPMTRDYIAREEARLRALEGGVDRHKVDKPRDPSGRACCGMRWSNKTNAEQLATFVQRRVASTNVLRDSPVVLGDAVGTERRTESGVDALKLVV